MATGVTSATLKIFTLLALPGVGQHTVRKILHHPMFLQGQLEDLVGLDRRLQRAMESPGAFQDAVERTEHLLDHCSRQGTQLLGLPDLQYPALLRELPDAPLVLYVKGTLQPHPLLAVVGTRNPTEHGVITCERITRHFVQQGMGVVSGLALGVDGVAHRTTLQEQGYTVAVLPGGLDQVTPTQHQKLAWQILEFGGALVGLHPPGTAVQVHHYLQRDRVQAGLSRGVVLVQSRLSGGSMHAFRAALEQGRVVGVPALSQGDLRERHPSTEVNRVLMNMEDPAGTLQVSPESVQQVMVLFSRDDYPQFQARLGLQVD